MATSAPLGMAVVVVSFNTRDVLERCLQSVVAAAPVLYGQVFMTGPLSGKGAVLKGIDAQSELAVSDALSIALLVLSGYCQIAFVATSNTRIQAATPDHLRGRVMALYAQSLMGVGPVGSFQAGALAHFFGAPFAMAFGAVVSGAFVTAARLLRPAVFKASE